MLRVAVVAALPFALASPAAAAVSLHVSKPEVVYGDSTVLRGAVEPKAGGRLVVIERRAGAGWVPVTRARTDSLGRYNAPLEPARSSVVRARVGRDPSPSLELAVTPRVTVKAAPGTAFVGVPLQLRVLPHAYAGRVAVTVPGASPVSARVRDGGARVLSPAPKLGSFRASVELSPASGFAGVVLAARLSAGARTLAIGSHGPDVAGLRSRLAELGLHVPGPSQGFDSRLYHSVIAFQKAFGLARTGTVDEPVWRALGRSAPVRARYRNPSPHIEIDKGRQILIVVRGGEVAGVLPVSSGATGNTPVGAFRILWKAAATSTWLGSAILYRTMTFHGNFAIHGYHSVPAYPASHGCVRVPIWAADWLYGQSAVGERVYVYP